MDGFNGEFNFIQFQVTWFKNLNCLKLLYACFTESIKFLIVEDVTQVSHLKNAKTCFHP